MATPLRSRGNAQLIGRPSFFHIFLTGVLQVTTVPDWPDTATRLEQFSSVLLACQKQNSSFIFWGIGWSKISTRK